MSGSNQAKAPAVHSQAPAGSGDTVTVGCKLPHGIVLQVNRAEKHHEPVLGGGSREIERWVPTGARYFVRGTAHPQNEAPKALIYEGFALTSGIPADVWAEWCKQHADADVLDRDRPLLRAFARPADTEAWAHESRSARTGQERLNPDALPNTGAMFPVQKDDRAA